MDYTAIILATGIAKTNAEMMCGRAATSAAQILVDLHRDNPGHFLREAGRFSIFEDGKYSSLWFFTRLGDPAHPSFLCRAPTPTEQTWTIKTQIMCGSDEATCQELSELINKIWP